MRAIYRTTVAAACIAAAVGFALGMGSRAALAQKPAPPAAEPSQEQVDQARGAFDRFLDAHPEIEGDVTRDPHALSSPDYVKDRPELQSFLETHPLVKADPRAFISSEQWRFQNRRSEWDDVMSDVLPFLAFVAGLLAVIWVLRIVLENRRWNRSLKVHEEIHTKLVEKFGSVQDLAAYMESEAGKRLLEWTPAVMESPRSVPYAAGRILWSLQAGLVVGLMGLGLLVIRDRVPDAVEPLTVFGALGVTIGAGFVLSALVSYGLSKRLGLLAAAPGGATQGALQANR
jgi:hypothetical protein